MTMLIQDRHHALVRELAATHLLERHHQFHLLLGTYGAAHPDVAKAKGLYEDALELADAVGADLKAAA